MNPYHKHLQTLEKSGEDVTLHRADAADVTGKISEVSDEGCTLTIAEDGEMAESVFVAHRDIRGVHSKGWDMGAIAG